MKITSNHIYTPKFGYDKKLNQELKDALSTHSDRRWAQTITTMNNHCNKLESNLRSAEKDKQKQDTHFEEYVDVFASAKQMLVGLVESTFEHLNFANREYKHYKEEQIKQTQTTSIDWRREVCDSIQIYVDEKSDIYEEEKAKKAVILPKKVALSENSFLEEFKPKHTSPKGLDDVQGMDALKEKLNERIIQYLKNPKLAQVDFEEYGINLPHGILLYGPPGCGKTFITEAMSMEASVPLYLLNISKAGSHYMNLTSKNIKEAFEEAIRIAEETGNICLLFMDEIDSMAFNRDRNTEVDDLKQVATLLQYMEKAQDSNVIIIGATNKYNLLDKAIKRRFDMKELVDIPDEKAIKALIIKTLLPMTKASSILSDDDTLNKISKMLFGYSNDSVCKITNEAARNAKKRNRAEITIEDFTKALNETSEEKPNRTEYLPDKNNRIGF